MSHCRPINLRCLFGSLAVGTLNRRGLRKRCREMRNLGYAGVYFDDLFFTIERREPHRHRFVLYRDDDAFVVARSDDELLTIKQIVRDCGLQIESAHFTQMLPPPGQPAEWIFPVHKRLLAMGQVVGLKRVTTHAGWMYGIGNASTMGETARQFRAGKITHLELCRQAQRRYGLRRMWTDSLRIYRQFCTEAARRRIAITIETACLEWLQVNTHPARLLAFIKEVRADNLGICVDAGHCHMQGLDAAKIIRGCRRYVRETHYHDNFGRRDEHNPIGIGTVNWLEIIRAMREVGYPGVVTFEQADHATNARNWRLLLEVVEKCHA